CEGGPAGLEVVLDAAFGASDRGGDGEVVGELGQHLAVSLLDAFERLADLEVQPGAADPRDAVVDDSAHELMREAAAGRRPGQRLDEPGSNRLLESRGEASRYEPGRAGKHAKLEAWPGHGGKLEQPAGLGGQA